MESCYRFAECCQPEGRADAPVPAGVQRLEEDPLQRCACGEEEVQGACLGGGPVEARIS